MQIWQGGKQRGDWIVCAGIGRFTMQMVNGMASCMNLDLRVHTCRSQLEYPPHALRWEASQGSLRLTLTEYEFSVKCFDARAQNTQICRASDVSCEVQPDNNTFMLA